MPARKSRQQLRRILDGHEAVLMASVFDPVSARIAESLGFEAALMGGSVASYAGLGMPDVILLTLSELSDQVRRCTRVSDVPLVIDGDHGYGNALNVMRTVVELDYAGGGAVALEDTLLPRPFGKSDDPSLVPFDEAVGKMKAMVAARGESDMLVFARTGAAAIAGIDEAVARARAFEAAGVDAIFIPVPRSRDEIDRISAAVKLPLVTAGLQPALCDRQYLASRRVKIWSAGHQTFAVVVGALHEAMKAVRGGTLSSQLPGQASEDAMACITGKTQFDDWTRQFLGGA
ncbi:MAG TPA: isocitrate lyase/PEP mutase family protein [Dongiaceae bacterium]|jgi:carboxyvinyl-carboxyphosphonate phosphorylmutase|nr:isocitrate lyase/PEP mutase family protein [Dongiaceae bacterium]